MFRVYEAVTEEQKAELYRFRYDIFVGEQHKYAGSADHSRRMLRDDLDEVATHLCLTENGRLIGSVRQVRGRAHANPETAARLGLDAFSCYPDHALSFTGRLLILPSHRGSRGLLPLLHENYERGRVAGVMFDFIHCRPQLVRLYEHLGHRRYGPHFQHQELGYQIPMVLVADDLPYLERIRSPFLARARHWPAHPANSEWFRSRFSDYDSLVSPIRSPESFLERFAARVTGEEMQLLDGLEPAELQELIGASQHLHVNAGAHLVGRGDMGPELYMVLDGIVEVRGAAGEEQHGPVLNTFGRGDFFGEMSVLTGRPRSSDVFAKTDLELLYIDQLALRRFVKGRPALGAKLLFNLARTLAERLESMSDRWISEQAKDGRDACATTPMLTVCH